MNYHDEDGQAQESYEGQGEADAQFEQDGFEHEQEEKENKKNYYLTIFNALIKDPLFWEVAYKGVTGKDLVYKINSPYPSDDPTNLPY